MFPKAKIESLAIALPEKKIDSLSLEKQIRDSSRGINLPNGAIEILTGVKERRILAEGKNASDLATEAAEKAIREAKLEKDTIDCLIFAAASSDITEPATANIVQENLKLNCPALDVKNACNSFLNAIEVAESFIISGKYKKVLICNGEVPSRGIRTKVSDKDQLRKSFAGYTLGDAGAAMIIGPSEGKSGIVYSKFMSYGEHWRVSTVMGGGTRYPRDMEKTYFEGETAGLKELFQKVGKQPIYDGLKSVGWTLEDLKKIIIHQVSSKTFDAFVAEAGLPREKLVIVLPELGNMVSASIPVALESVKADLKEGDKLMLLGLAAGISISVMLIIW